MQIIPKNTREEIRIHREPYKGHDLMHIRVWAANCDGEMIPTKKGISIQTALVAHIIEALVHENDEECIHV
ncbi:MAG: transcriptional coactivator p15/PC4 family protein [Paracoccaceae bacterium]|nr:transcriptional coactivator p15/PC4 family protein [Paracoccaceae bacterium]